VNRRKREQLKSIVSASSHIIAMLSTSNVILAMDGFMALALLPETLGEQIEKWFCPACVEKNRYEIKWKPGIGPIL
jgi:hypothetical protein